MIIAKQNKKLIFFMSVSNYLVFFYKFKCISIFPFLIFIIAIIILHSDFNMGVSRSFFLNFVLLSFIVVESFET